LTICINIDVSIQSGMLTRWRCPAMAQGLDDVIAADTVLSHVDGKAGRLIVRGFDLEQIAGRLDYEGVVALLWDGFAGEPSGDSAVRAALAAARTRAFAIGKPLYAEAA